MISKHLLSSLALALSLSLTGCGGGGGSSSGSSGDGGNGEPVPASVSGTAAKGIISGALVTIKDSNGKSLGTTTTDPEGHYEINVGTYVGPIKITLTSPKTGNNAQVTCDVKQCGDKSFGEKYPLNFTLSAVTYVSPSSQAVNAQLTPLTTLVAKKVSSARLNQASITQASAFVKNLLGLSTDPNQVTPIDLTKAKTATDTEKQYALINAAVEQLAQKPGKSVDSVLSDLSSNFNNDKVDPNELKHIADAAQLVADAVEDVKSGNNDLPVASAASNVSDNLHTLADACKEFCKPDTGVTGTNLNKARALVQKARGLVTDVQQLADEIDSHGGSQTTGANYNSNNLLNKIRDLGLGESQEPIKPLRAFGWALRVSGFQVSHVLKDGGTLNSDLKDAAGAYWEDQLDDFYCQYNYGQYYKYDTQADCQTAETAAKSQFTNQFVSGTIVRNGNSWSLTNAKLDMDGKLATNDPMTVSLSAKFPNTVQPAQGTASIGVRKGKNEIDFSGSATYAGGSMKIAKGSKLVATLDKAFYDYADDSVSQSLDNRQKAVIESANLTANVTMSLPNLTFTGQVKADAMSSTTMKSLNGQYNYDVLLPIPKSVTLSGKFATPNKSETLNASVNLTIDNADTYGYVEAAVVRNKLANYSYNSTDNSLTVKAGVDSANQMSIVYTLDIQAEGSGQYSHTNYYIDATCTATGTAVCPAPSWRSYFGGYNAIVKNVITATACDDLNSQDRPYEYDFRNGTCWHDISADDSGVGTNIRVAFQGWNSRWMLRHFDVRVPKQGIYEIGRSRDYDYYDNSTRFISISDQAGFIPMYLGEPVMDFDANNRYLLGSVRIKTNGKLSSNLPNMSVELFAKRKGFSTGDASLTLGWDNNKLIVDYPLEVDDNHKLTGRTATITDGNGTTMTLKAPSDTAPNNILGTITKDGTTYGTIKQENSTYLVTYKDGTFATLY